MTKPVNKQSSSRKGLSTREQRPMQSFAPQMIESVLLHQWEKVSNAIYALRARDTVFEYASRMSLLLELLPYWRFDDDVKRELEYVLQERPSLDQLDQRAKFIISYVSALAEFRFPLPPKSLLESVILEAEGIGGSLTEKVQQMSGRALQASRCGIDVQLDTEGYQNVEVTNIIPKDGGFSRKRKWTDDGLRISFFKNSVLINSLYLGNRSTELLLVDAPNGDLLILDNTFLLRRYDGSGILLSQAYVPSAYELPAVNGFRYDRGRNLVCSEDCSRIFVSDMCSVYEFDASLLLVRKLDFDILSVNDSWKSRLNSVSDARPRNLQNAKLQDAMAAIGLSELPRDLESLKQAWRDRIRSVHPDLNPKSAGAHDLTILANEAFVLLQNEVFGHDGGENSLQPKPVPIESYYVGTDRVQDICVTENGLVVATYLGVIFSVDDSGCRIDEQIGVWLNSVEVGHGCRAYRTICSAIVVPEDGPFWEVPGHWGGIAFSESYVAMSDNRRGCVFTKRGELLLEFVAASEIRSVVFEGELPVFHTSKKKISVRQRLLESTSSMRTFKPVDDSIITAAVEFDLSGATYVRPSKVCESVTNWLYDKYVPSLAEVLDACADCDIEMRDSFGFAPIHLAVGGSCELVELLLEAGADVNAVVRPSRKGRGSADGDTVLHLVVGQFDESERAEELKMLTCLLKHGADPNISNQAGVPPLRLAVNGGLLQAAELLLRYGAKANAVDRRGMSLLKKARRIGSMDMVKLLIAYGAHE